MKHPAIFLLAVLLVHPIPLAAAPAAVPAAPSGSVIDGPIERIRGIYLQRAIELATVGTRLVRLTRMTRFRRCGQFRGMAEDFNKHLVEVTGREVEGVGFVAGFVNAIEGCTPAAAWGGATALSGAAALSNAAALAARPPGAARSPAAD